MQRQINVLTTLTAVFGIIGFMAVIALVGSLDFSTESGKPVDPNVYWAVPVAILSAVVAFWSQHQTEKITAKIAEREERRLQAQRADKCARYMEGNDRLTGF